MYGSSSRSHAINVILKRLPSDRRISEVVVFHFGLEISPIFFGSFRKINLRLALAATHHRGVFVYLICINIYIYIFF